MGVQKQTRPTPLTFPALFRDNFSEENAGNPQILITFRLKLISSTTGLKTSTFLLLIGSVGFTPRHPISN